MIFSNYETIRFSHEGRVLTITLDGPGDLNPINGRMHEELARVFIDAQSDDDSDLVVLTGAGNGFSAGGDMEWFQGMIDDPAKFRAIAPEARRIVFSLLELEKPIICRLNGAAAGLGATIALMCDVIIASENAVIGDPHVKVGLVAGDGGAVIWPQLVGFAKAKEMLMTGDMMKAREALDFGLLNHVVEAEKLDDKVTEVANKILANPRWAVRWTKTVANIPLREIAVKIMDASMGYEMVSNLLADRQEAVTAFKDKRLPKFSGE